jgi:hypothetical protein
MPRNGAGLYNLPTGNPVVTGTTITSTWANTTMSDIGAELTNSVPRDGQAPPTANLPMGNFKHTGVANGVATTDYAAYGQLQTAVAGLGPLIPTAQTSFRNALINGDFLVWQRGVTNGIGTLGTPLYTADRFWSYTNQATAPGQTNQVTGLIGLYGVKLNRFNGNTAVVPIYLGQTIEWVNCIRLRGQTCVLSWYAKAGANFSGAGSAMLVQVDTGTGIDQGSSACVNGTWTGQTAPLTTTQVITTTMTRYSAQVTIPSNATEIGIRLGWTPVSTAGADDSLTIECVQLEVGTLTTAPTPFEFVTGSEALARCQRYYQTIAPEGVFFSTWGSAGQNIYTVAYLKVTMRTAPTAGASSWAVANTTNPPTLNDADVNFLVFQCAVVATGAAITYNNSVCGASAEL